MCVCVMLLSGALLEQVYSFKCLGCAANESEKDDADNENKFTRDGRLAGAIYVRVNAKGLSLECE